MTRASDLQLLELSELVWPVTYRYLVQTTWGASQQELTVDVPPLQGDVDATKAYGPALWQLAVAGATSFLGACRLIDCSIWKVDVREVVPLIPPRAGQVIKVHAQRDDTPCLVFDTGHRDSLSLRRFPVICAPKDWVRNKLLTFEGMQALENMAQRMIIASNAAPYDFYYGQFIAYTQVEYGKGHQKVGLGFRRVRYIRVMQHTMRAPDPRILE